ncbi:MAG: class I SAM-dependent RNA methyltransferase [Chitinispirillaceae bacterium]|nr:class I SAM-dependent RNA methyltransferase [Chitinispirillaceae bacterium]
MNYPVDLSIEKVVHGGRGLARTGEGVVLVDGVLPGERVRAVETGKINGMRIFQPLERLKPSAGRRDPPCRYFGNCGGCDWLFIEPQLQAQLKRSIFIEALERIGKLTSLAIPEIVAGPEYGYRRRVQVKISTEKKTGFFKRGSNDVVQIENCPLCTERINGLLARCAREPALLPDDCANLKVIDGDRILASQPVLDGCTAAVTEIYCGERRFTVTGDDFFQSNAPLLVRMAEWIAACCSGETLVDLYGGTGFFSVMLAGKFSGGMLIESDRKMVRRARENFKDNGIKHFTAVAVPAEAVEGHIPSKPSVLLVDPPRPGLTRNAREAVGRIAAETLVYVSCNCATQARDVGYLVKKCGYSIVASALVDLYPNTHHTETVVVMKRRGDGVTG